MQQEEEAAELGEGGRGEAEPGVGGGGQEEAEPEEGAGVRWVSPRG